MTGYSFSCVRVCVCVSVCVEHAPQEQCNTACFPQQPFKKTPQKHHLLVERNNCVVIPQWCKHQLQQHHPRTPHVKAVWAIQPPQDGGQPRGNGQGWGAWCLCRHDVLLGGCIAWVKEVFVGYIVDANAEVCCCTPVDELDALVFQAYNAVLGLDVTVDDACGGWGWVVVVGEATGCNVGGGGVRDTRCVKQQDTRCVKQVNIT